jgi:hypothetical protein
MAVIHLLMSLPRINLTAVRARARSQYLSLSSTHVQAQVSVLDPLDFSFSTEIDRAHSPPHAASSQNDGRPDY